MSSWKILHNPRCSKSRQALKILQNEGIEPEIVEYLKEPLNRKELKELVAALKVKPGSIVRKKEEEFKNLKLDLEKDSEVLEALAKYPKLMERPIIWRGKKAIVGRPPERVKELF